MCSDSLDFGCFHGDCSVENASPRQLRNKKTGDIELGSRKFVGIFGRVQLCLAWHLPNILREGFFGTF